MRSNKIKKRQDEEKLYEQVSDELQQENKKKGLWLKAIADSNGDLAIADSLYVKYRVQSLRDDINSTNVKPKLTPIDLSILSKIFKGAFNSLKTLLMISLLCWLGVQVLMVVMTILTSALSGWGPSELTNTAGFDNKQMLAFNLTNGLVLVVGSYSFLFIFKRILRLFKKEDIQTYDNKESAIELEEKDDKESTIELEESNNENSTAPLDEYVESKSSYYEYEEIESLIIGIPIAPRIKSAILNGDFEFIKDNKYQIHDTRLIEFIEYADLCGEIDIKNYLLKFKES
ncbi:hypothetical protein [Colwellia piezophila]|uniref:hypothetical protein n=1 Tax=Colwellia piezophila TaxID=211668 RepID=UPI00037F6BC8|nr:hypothetical protein [Colwellia piezophila]